MKIRLHEQAYNDVDEAARWYDEQEPGLGDDFLAELNAYFTSLVDSPGVWPLWPGARQAKYAVRRRLLARFPYALAYQLVEDTIIVVAVAPHKKRPRYWSGRIER